MDAPSAPPDPFDPPDACTPAADPVAPPDRLLQAAQERSREWLERIWQERDRRRDVWVFGYASLIWRPEVQHSECRAGRVYGYHRSFRMLSRVNRGTHQRPGLVFALRHGGSCAGIALRVPRQGARAEFERLWQREMPLPTYEPRWLPCHTPGGVVPALGFVLPRDSPAYVGRLDDDAMLSVLRHAQGRYGSTLDYLLRTAAGLRHLGIRDAEVQRLVRLAQQHGLMQEPTDGPADPQDRVD